MGQRRTLLGGMCFGILWMSSQAVIPMVIGLAIDRGIAGRDGGELVKWSLVMLLIGLVQAGSGILRHRFAVTNWLITAYRTVQLVTRQTVRLGGSLPRKVSTGEVVAIGTSDLSHLGQVMDVSARFAGAVVSFGLVSTILLNTSVTLGLVVLLGVPLLMLLVGPLLAPLQRRSTAQRALMGELSNTASDIVGGLRVLRGIGGEQVFHERYRLQSQATRRAGVAVARLQSMLDALQVFLPGLFVVLVVWLGARSAVAGEISAGQLVAFYGYSAFLMVPLRTATEYANKLIRGRVSAKRVCHVLSLVPDVNDPATPAPSPAPDSDLYDVRTGLRVPAGVMLAIVSEQPDESAELADRLGLCAPVVDDDVRLGEVPLTSLALAEVRSRIVVSDTAAVLFSGPLADRLDVAAGEDRFTRSHAPSTPPRPTTSSTRCPTGSRPTLPSAVAPSRVVSASDWCSCAPSPATPRSWSWSSRPPRSTPTPKPGSRRGCAGTAPAGPRSSPPAAPCCWTPSTRWPSCAVAGSWRPVGTATCWPSTPTTAPS